MCHNDARYSVTGFYALLFHEVLIVQVTTWSKCFEVVGLCI